MIDSYCNSVCYAVIKLFKPRIDSEFVNVKLPPALRQISDPSYELTKTAPLAISPQLFHSKLKTLLFKKSYPASSSSNYLASSLNSNTIHHSRLTVCLPDSLDLTRCLSILFWISACE